MTDKLPRDWPGVANDAPLAEKILARQNADIPEFVERRLRANNSRLGITVAQGWKAGFLDVMVVGGELKVRRME